MLPLLPVAATTNAWPSAAEAEPDNLRMLTALTNKPTQRAEWALCADCNDPITGCSSQSVIVTSRRSIAKRITGLRRQADEQLNGGRDSAG
jgi:hypothetical protein